MYEVQLALSSHELQDLYAHHEKELLAKGEKPEISEIVLIEKTKSALEQFIVKHDGPDLLFMKTYLREIQKRLTY